MGLKKIYVSRSAVEQNNKSGDTKDFVFTVIDGADEHRTNSMILLGPCEIKYDPDAQEGSRVWIETYDKVMLKYENISEPRFPVLVSL